MNVFQIGLLVSTYLIALCFLERMFKRFLNGYLNVFQIGLLVSTYLSGLYVFRVLALRYIHSVVHSKYPLSSDLPHKQKGTLRGPSDRSRSQDSFHGAQMGGLRPRKGPLRGPWWPPRSANGGPSAPQRAAARPIYQRTEDTIQYSIFFI